MKHSFLKAIIPIIAFLVMTQTASAQWTSSMTAVYLDALNAAKKVGIGTSTPATILNVASNLSNDGIRVNQTGNTAATLSLQAGPGGRNWALFSTGTGNSQGAGHLSFFDWTSNLERMRIASNGNVGIGAGVPTNLFQVNATTSANNATVKFSDTQNRRIFFVPRLANAGYNSLSLVNDAGIFWSDNNSVNPINGSGLVIAPNETTHKAGIRLAADGKATLPGYNVTVGNGLTKIGLGHAYGADLAYGTAYLGFNAVRSRTYVVSGVPETPGTWTFDSDGGNNGGNIIWGDVSGKIRFATIASTGAANQTLSDVDILNNRTKMSIAPNGKVTIGAENTITNTVNAYGLYVRGGILTEKVKVAIHGTAQWADYVFEPDYKMLSLEEVEAFVEKENHLPNVPSTQELMNSGLDLAVMQAKQMEKIEELKLYLIEMKKEIKALQSENVALKTLVSNGKN